VVVVNADLEAAAVDAMARALVEMDGLTWEEATQPQGDDGTQAEAYAMAAEVALAAVLGTTVEVWACNICGPHKDSRAMWCGAGCGRDYNQMSKQVLGIGEVVK
jgi:flavin-binding protein dodecin